jgi:hypothetical protein
MFIARHTLGSYAFKLTDLGAHFLVVIFPCIGNRVVESTGPRDPLGGGTQSTYFSETGTFSKIRIVEADFVR